MCHLPSLKKRTIVNNRVRQWLLDSNHGVSGISGALHLDLCEIVDQPKCCQFDPSYVRDERGVSRVDSGIYVQSYDPGDLGNLTQFVLILAQSAMSAISVNCLYLCQ